MPAYFYNFILSSNQNPAPSLPHLCILRCTTSLKNRLQNRIIILYTLKSTRAYSYVRSTVDLLKKAKVNTYYIISTAGSHRAYFDGFQIVAVSYIAEFSFRFCCFVLP